MQLKLYQIMAIKVIKKIILHIKIKLKLNIKTIKSIPIYIPRLYNIY